MTLFVKLLLAHFIADFFLQPKAWVEDKINYKFRSNKLAYHIVVHMLLYMVVLWDWNKWPAVLIIGCTHYIIDLAKLFSMGKFNLRLLFWLDQFLHLLVLLAIAQFYEPFLHILVDKSIIDHLTLIALAIVLITNVGMVIISVVISPWSPRTEDRDDQSLLRAGRFIGQMERLLVFAFIAIGYLPGVGFLLAAKSIFRFGDLRQSKDRKLTEYVLIGTLVSFVYAFLIGLIYTAVRPLL